MLCKNCNNMMLQSISFHDGKSYKFSSCPKCYFKSKENIIRKSDAIDILTHSNDVVKSSSKKTQRRK